uniref:RRM domain-containing protein n=2 Tax=Setaria viridis TaxID=4556 RepID=A0A4U6UWN8_SETVI|nr:hypothetical protein SEVIR_4G038400v2 [Setaria viridis]
MARVSASELEVLLRTFNSEHPGVVLGHGFLRAAAIVDGLRDRTTNEELGRFFEAFGDVRAVVADEGYRGERLGLVVFPDAGNCSAATNQTSDNYDSIVKVDSIGINREFLIKAVRLPKRMQDVIRFSNVRNLMGVLFAVNPEVADDLQFNFLERSVLLIGVSSETTPRDLTTRCFGGRDVEAAVMIRDPETSERVGMVVFAEAGDATVVKNRQPMPRLYRTCILANSVNHVHQAVLEGSEDRERRKETSATMRSLIPPQYLQSGDSTDFHLRCLLLKSSSLVDLSQGLHHLCCVAEEKLQVSGRLCAAVVSEALDAAILVYDDSQSTDKAYRSASRLPAGSLRLYDSSLFPMPAGKVVTRVSDQVPERGMLPELFTKPEYLGRVVSLRGIDANKWDARELVYYLTGCKLEALYIHRAERKVFAVFGSQSDVHLARLHKPRAWGKLCGWRLRFEDLDEACFQPTVPAPAPPEQKPYPGVPKEAIKLAKRLTRLSISHCSSGDTKGIAEGLIRLAAVSKPDVLLRKDFADTVVLLMGIDAGTIKPDLRSELVNAFGEVDLLRLHNEQGVALAVFKSQTAAAKLHQQPAETLRRFGVDRCEPIPGELDVAALVSGTSEMVRSFGETYGRVVSYVDSRSASAGTSSGD